ncbi:MAG: hypothetical protein NC432_06095 [Roseburia sp.]|nr:hypothetical protein [Roseburia sp.]MCM1099135.1 hypothetical protein [Ruminococcus flavefaciens]
MAASFLEHLTVGFCWWDIPGTILLVAAVAFVVIRKKSLKKELEELEGR